MKRLTTDKQSGNVENLLNYAYASEGKVYLRFGNGKENIDLCEYIAQVASNKRCEPTLDEVMEGWCTECDCELAILYAVATQAAELRGRLKMYEDAVDKGLIPSITELPEEVEGKV